MFRVPISASGGRRLHVIANAAPPEGEVGEELAGWDHVSVSVDGSRKPPSWDEMCAVKRLFWEPEACVVQFHPPESDYVNIHEGCLHLWRRVGGEILMPPVACV